MYKLVVLSALVACVLAAPAPGLLHAAPLAYTAHVAAPVAIPTAYSHQSRTDVHHKGVVATTYTAPAVVAAPAVHTYAAPAIQTYAAPAVHGYAGHLAYAAPVHAAAVSTYAAHVPAAYAAGYVAPIGYAHHY